MAADDAFATQLVALVERGDYREAFEAFWSEASGNAQETSGGGAATLCSPDGPAHQLVNALCEADDETEIFDAGRPALRGLAG